MSTNFHVLLTNAGAALQTNAWQGGDKINLTHFQLGGDAAQVSATQTQVAKPVMDKTPISELKQKQDDAGVLEVTCIIPPDIGGFMMNNIGLFTDSGVLFAAANLPSDYKPTPIEGSSKETIITLYISLGSTDTVNLTIDPYKVIATQDWVNTASLPAQHVSDFNNPHKVTATQVGAWSKGENKRTAYHFHNNGAVQGHNVNSGPSWKELGVHSSSTVTPKFERSKFHFLGSCLMEANANHSNRIRGDIVVKVAGNATCSSAIFVSDGVIGSGDPRFWNGGTFAIAPVRGWSYENLNGASFSVEIYKQALSNGDAFFQFGKVDLLIIEEEI